MSEAYEHPLTFGEKACGVAFNPGGDSMVHAIKTKYAELVDVLHALRMSNDNPEIARMISIAITEAQTSQMWAVKAITWKP
jgi:hypothetical protein